MIDLRTATTTKATQPLLLAGIAVRGAGDLKANASVRFRLLARHRPDLGAQLMMAADGGEGDWSHLVHAALHLRPIRPARSKSVLAVADFDDLLFDHPESSPQVRSGRASQRSIASKTLRYQQALRGFRHVVVSTEPLAQAVRAINPEAAVAVIPNGLSSEWVRQGRLLYPAWKPGDRKIIRYLPGTSSHDADFAVVTDVLADFLAKHRDVALEIVGPLRFAADRFPADRISHLPSVYYEHLPAYLASSWTTIAPLEDTPFNACKSALKFLESAAFACPCIVTSIPDMIRHRDGGVLLARSADEWRRHLEALRDDGERMAAGERTRRHVEVEGMDGEGTRQLVAQLAEWLR